jgi:alkyl sulfatase BDS1-like metallo-beta-lactamase superfamily hydrolase
VWDTDSYAFLTGEAPTSVNPSFRHVWSTYLTEAIETFGRRTDVARRDLYAYLHDQTRRLLIQGHTGDEMAEMIELPPTLTNSWSTHATTAMRP